MLISPPFLPLAEPNESDEDFINRAMNSTEGAFPLGQDMIWHGGIHLTAPKEGNTHLPVRAIADGTVAYFRKPRPSSNDSNHPLNYRNGWTDDGCLILRHETDIGEGANAKVVFYSIYMHLSSIKPADISIGLIIYRKDELGTAGRVYGAAHKIHFEIICNQKQLGHFIGRDTGTLSTLNNGRADSCWGDVYYHVPPEVLFYAACPANPRSATNESSIVHRHVDPYFVSMKYGLGQCTLTTFNETGTRLGEHKEKQDYEYNLYTTANTLYPSSPSAGYELLRFGRVLGPDLLQPNDAAHWRQVAYPASGVHPAGVGWVNLKGPTVTVYSDADFPHWQGWKLIDDDTDGDGRCHSRQIMELVGISNTPATPQQRTDCNAMISKAGNQGKLKRLICKFPSEWESANFTNRYGWLSEGDEPIISTQAQARLKAHYEALAFWEDADLKGIEPKHWHFPPKEFINTFRKCGWLSRNELIQLLPMNSLRKTSIWQWEPVSLSGAATLLSNSSSDALMRRNDLNKALRKFLITTPVRMACFFGNATQETQWYQKFHEGSPYWYRPWDGRGFLHLTHPSNYIKYWRFKGYVIDNQIAQVLMTKFAMANNNRPVVQGQKSMYDPTNSLSDLSTAIPQEVIVKREAVKASFDAANSAGAYWVWSGSAKQADGYHMAPSSTLRTVMTNLQTKHYYENFAFGNVAATVNTGSPSSSFSSIWGIQARFMAFTNAQVILMDRLQFPISANGLSMIPLDFVRRSIE